MKAVNHPKTDAMLTRRDLLKLAGGALGAGALGFTAGLLNQAPPVLPAPASLPDYVDDSLGLPVFRGPYMQQAQMAAFLFPADQAQLSALCDRHLNTSAEAPYKYEPLIASLVVIFSDMLVSSLDERDRQVGMIPETELSFWLPVSALRKTGAGYVPDHFAWFLPYLFVDDGNAIATGREVYGFNKLQAQFQKPADIRDPQFLTSVMGFQEFGPSARAGLLPLLELRRDDPAADTIPNADWQDWSAAQAAISQQLLSGDGGDPGSSWVNFAAHLVLDNAPLVFLKQFRDAANTRLACYQSLVEAPIKLQKFYEGGFLPGGYHLQLNSLASHPLSTLLGIKSQAAALGVWMKVDFSLESGQELWRHTRSAG